MRPFATLQKAAEQRCHDNKQDTKSGPGVLLRLNFDRTEVEPGEGILQGSQRAVGGTAERHDDFQVSSVGEGVILDFGWWILDELEGFHPEMVF
jgi:hypothetical protein